MNRISLLFLLLLGSIQFSYGQAGNFVKGAVIVLEPKGLVQASDSTGKLITNGLSSGTVLSDGFSLSTGLSGQLTILFSNGIVATIEPESKLSLLTFLQKSFEPNNLTLDSIDKEPTESITKIIVEYGSVILLSKKLSPSSQFEITTQAGTTKILGTAFRVEQDALGVSKIDVTDSTVSFTPTGKGQPILLTEGKGLDVTNDGIAAQREVDASVNKLVNEVNNQMSKLSSSISLSILKSAVNKAQDLSPNSLPPKPNRSTFSTEDNSRDDDKVYGPFNQDLRFAYLRQWQINQRSIHGGETSSFTQAVSISYGYDPETGEIIIYFHDKYGRVIGIRRISIHDHDYLLLLEALSPWITDNDKKLEALALSIFMEQLALGYSYEEGINDAIQSALRFARIFLTKVTLSDSLPAENVWKASDLVNEFSENPYAYEFGLLLAKYGALGSSDGHQGVDSMETIGNRILSLLGGRKKLKDSKHLLSILEDGGKPGEVFNEGDEQNEVTLDGELLGTRSANLSSETADDFNVDVDRVTGVVGSEITIVNGAKLDPSEIEERDTNQIFAISAAQDVIIEGDVTLENHHNSEQAVVIGAANGIHVRSKSASAFFDAEFVSKYLGEDDPIFLSEEEQIKPKKSPESVHIKNHGADLGLGAYDKLELIDVDISTEGHLAVGSLDELKILSTRFDEEVEFSEENLESVLSLNQFSAGDENEKGNIYLYAHNRIAVNGLGFDEHVREIYMDAITVDLKNVKFPDSSRVILKSRNGYPTFGEKERKVGHVNFIKNVYHGTDAVNASFFSNDASSRISNKRVDSGKTPAIRIQPHSN